MDKQNVEVLGEITAKFYDQTTLYKWQKLFNKFISAFRKQWPRMMRMYQLGELIMVDKHTNVICDAGFNAVCRRLANDITYSGLINYMLSGTGAGSAAATDTQLITEAYRNAVASGTASGRIAFLMAYFTETEIDGTFTEFGNVIDGEAGADTGLIWSHLAGLNWVKTNTMALVVDCQYSFASV